jgi:hypothetical protein
MERRGLVPSLFVFVIAVVVGYFSGSNSWRGVVYLDDGTLANDGNVRTPAAIKRELDFSHLNGAELISATQKRLVTAARMIIHEGSIGIELGHFVARDESGRRQLACDSIYNRLWLRFDAEGIASAGEKSSMVIDAPCQISGKDLTAIEPIWVPVKQLLESPATNVEFSVTPETKIRFENMSGSWPVMWSLQSIRLYHAGDRKHEVNITTQELRELRSQPFVMNWMATRSAKGQ